MITLAGRIHRHRPVPSRLVPGPASAGSAARSTCASGRRRWVRCCPRWGRWWCCQVRATVPTPVDPSRWPRWFRDFAARILPARW